MVIVQTKRQGRRITGGKYKLVGKKKKFFGNNPTLPNIAARRVKDWRMRGGNVRVKLLSEQVVNVIDPKTHKAKKAKMLNVVDNPANRHYVRRNALTKGAVVDTDAGKVRITSRPAQDGCVNGVLVQ